MKNWKIFAIAFFIPVITLVVGTLKPPQPTASAQPASSKPVQKPENKKTVVDTASTQNDAKQAETKAQPAPELVVQTGCEAVRTAISKYKDWDINIMTAIAHAESTTDVNKNGVIDPGEDCYVNASGDGHIAYQQNGRLYGYSVSSLQVRILPGREHCDSFDLTTNIECGHNIWLGQGYSAWTMYSNGRYLQYL